MTSLNTAAAELTVVDVDGAKDLVVLCSDGFLENCCMPAFPSQGLIEDTTGNSNQINTDYIATENEVSGIETTTIKASGHAESGCVAINTSGSTCSSYVAQQIISNTTLPKTIDEHHLQGNEIDSTFANSMSALKQHNEYIKNKRKELAWNTFHTEARTNADQLIERRNTLLSHPSGMLDSLWMEDVDPKIKKSSVILTKENQYGTIADPHDDPSSKHDPNLLLNDTTTDKDNGTVTIPPFLRKQNVTIIDQLCSLDRLVRTIIPSDIQAVRRIQLELQNQLCCRRSDSGSSGEEKVNESDASDFDNDVDIGMSDEVLEQMKHTLIGQRQQMQALQEKMFAYGVNPKDSIALDPCGAVGSCTSAGSIKSLRRELLHQVEESGQKTEKISRELKLRAMEWTCDMDVLKQNKNECLECKVSSSNVITNELIQNQRDWYTTNVTNFVQQIEHQTSLLDPLKREFINYSDATSKQEQIASLQSIESMSRNVSLMMTDLQKGLKQVTLPVSEDPVEELVNVAGTMSDIINVLYMQAKGIGKEVKTRREGKLTKEKTNVSPSRRKSSRIKGHNKTLKNNDAVSHPIPIEITVEHDQDCSTGGHYCATEQVTKQSPKNVSSSPKLIIGKPTTNTPSEENWSVVDNTDKATISELQEKLQLLTGQYEQVCGTQQAHLLQIRESQEGMRNDIMKELEIGKSQLESLVSHVGHSCKIEPEMEETNENFDIPCEMQPPTEVLDPEIEAERLATELKYRLAIDEITYEMSDRLIELDALRDGIDKQSGQHLQMITELTSQNACYDSEDAKRENLEIEMKIQEWNSGYEAYLYDLQELKTSLLKFGSTEANQSRFLSWDVQVHSLSTNIEKLLGEVRAIQGTLETKYQERIEARKITQESVVARSLELEQLLLQSQVLRSKVHKIHEKIQNLNLLEGESVEEALHSIRLIADKLAVETTNRESELRQLINDLGALKDLRSFSDNVQEMKIDASKKQIESAAQQIERLSSFAIPNLLSDKERLVKKQSTKSLKNEGDAETTLDTLAQEMVPAVNGIHKAAEHNPKHQLKRERKRLGVNKAKNKRGKRKVKLQPTTQRDLEQKMVKKHTEGFPTTSCLEGDQLAIIEDEEALESKKLEPCVKNDEILTIDKAIATPSGKLSSSLQKDDDPETNVANNKSCHVAGDENVMRPSSSCADISLSSVSTLSSGSFRIEKDSVME